MPDTTNKIETETEVIYKPIPETASNSEKKNQIQDRYNFNFGIEEARESDPTPKEKLHLEAKKK